MENTKAIELKYPIPVKSETGSEIQVNVLQIGRLKAKHLKLLPKGFGADEGKIDPADILPLIGALANIPLESVDEIDIEDLTKIAEGMESFLLVSQDNGSK